MIPILKIKKFVDLLIEFVKTDYENKTDKQESFLYKVLGDDSSDGWSFYDNAVSLFSRDGTNRRSLATRLMFDRTRADLPTIHVREPAKVSGNYDSIGGLDGSVTVNEDGSISDTVRKTFSSKFELMITSGNSLECVLIQEVLESAIISAMESLVIPFFEIVNLTSRELIMENDIERNMLFVKSIDLDIKYEKSGIPKLYTEENIQSIIFNDSKLIGYDRTESEEGSEEPEPDPEEGSEEPEPDPEEPVIP